MPYIAKERRTELIESDPRIQNAGELNFILTIICKEYFETNPNYQTINDIIGALEGCKLEFYRRIVGSYEDKKILENGDCY